ncbi:hypothetical protein DCO58_10210 [Helicobacter saguini]|uniref:DUF1311 domain-containing protein n=1 Tax=Helicobacter saguini TaxID=1548018 RepID=A0A347VPJ9_9HELI|nr:hypothetical protein [Helicobacter saguini]MWV61323.1 hypothetical protein [Helicobacter saguini]MWV68008.1 hypothetical protein [Helicobacter saguini]MWV70525.1 hypothetical protein [Helicobacter saguini]MWV72428.1 hypothetical protein [Helicobacter saguini]TLD94808.1 hypothetical protein LS64_004755 [Helicobacter saguini]
MLRILLLIAMINLLNAANCTDSNISYNCGDWYLKEYYDDEKKAYEKAKLSLNKSQKRALYENEKAFKDQLFTCSKPRSVRKAVETSKQCAERMLDERIYDLQDPLKLLKCSGYIENIAPKILCETYNWEGVYALTKPQNPQNSPTSQNPQNPQTPQYKGTITIACSIESCKAAYFGISGEDGCYDNYMRFSFTNDTQGLLEFSPGERFDRSNICRVNVTRVKGDIILSVDSNFSNECKSACDATSALQMNEKYEYQDIME